MAWRRWPSTPESRAAQARLAAATRDHGVDHDLTRAARAAWEAERYVAVMRELAPVNLDAVSDEQRARVLEALAPHCTNS